MRKQYDFSQGKPNPYAARLKRQVTIRLDGVTINYFKELAAETGGPTRRLSTCICGMRGDEEEALHEVEASSVIPRSPDNAMNPPDAAHPPVTLSLPRVSSTLRRLRLA
jgi:hypothetical protein